MLRSVKDLRGYAIRATDGTIGEVADLYFDDDDWAIRYLVVDTGGWLSGRKVLISPHAIGHPDWLDRVLPVSLTRAKIEHSPDVDTQKPVSRQHEAAHFGYYGYPYYWDGAGLWGMGAYPGSLTTEDKVIEDMKARRPSTPREAPDESLAQLPGRHRVSRSSEGRRHRPCGGLSRGRTHLGHSLPHRGHEQLVGRPPGDRGTAMDRRREVGGRDGLGRSDPAGRQKRASVQRGGSTRSST